MRTFRCLCGNRLFFENTLCLACRREVGWCPGCCQLTAILPQADGTYLCGIESCATPLQKCHNYAVENVCNRCVASPEDAVAAARLCDYCNYTATIPDLSIHGNREKWYRLEIAKRRLLYTLDMLSLPYGSREEGFVLPLTFEFKADVYPAGAKWRAMGKTERVYTGHADGVITINVQEADSVEREKLRQQFGEAHRTLLGHFRHEIGHYYWQLMIQNDPSEQARFVQGFGDPDDPGYAASKDHYYAHGAPPDWPTRFISAYASMHPWEDFAESFAAYLDMAAVLDTAGHRGFGPGRPLTALDFDEAVKYFLSIGLMVNELNREMGLVDLIPDLFPPPVTEKLRYVHALIKSRSEILAPA